MILNWQIYISSGKMLESHLIEETRKNDQSDKKVSVDIKIVSPRGCVPLPRGYIMYTSMKHMYKIRVQRDFAFEFATDGRSDKAILLTT